MHRLLALVASVLVVLASAPALAADAWSDPFPGVKRLHRQTSTQNINALVVDLCAPGVSLRGTASAERKKKTSTFGASVGAQAAINGDFFSYADYSTNGPSAHAGQIWGGADHSYVAPIAFGAARAEIYAHEAGGGPEPWAKEVVSGHPTVLWGGAKRDNNGDPLCTARHPRTAVGLSADRKKLVMAVVDGRKPNRLGFTCDELSALLAELGAADGMNLDGGGSSTMWMGGSVISMPSDSGGERTVANHLALFATGSGPAAHCPVPDYRAKFVGAAGWPGGTDMTLSPGQDVTGSLDFENTGKATWKAGITKLGTTEPRDHAAAFAHPSWSGPNRLAVLDQDVAPGKVGHFAFTLRAPEEPGEYLEHLNLVHEGVTWFSDSGGPADSVSWMKVTVEDLGEPPLGEAGGAAGAGSTVGPSGAGGTGGKHSGGQATKVVDQGGDGCALAAPRGGSNRAWWTLVAGLSLAARRRRRPADQLPI